MLCLLLSIGQFMYAQTRKTTVSGNFSQLKDNDTVRLCILKHGNFTGIMPELYSWYYGGKSFRVFTVPGIFGQLYFVCCPSLN